MQERTLLTNHFLIAMPSLEDINFQKTVTYICEHNNNGAIGIIINKPLSISLEEIFQQLDIKVRLPDIASQTVYYGGPVQQERGFVLHRPFGKWRSTLKTSEEINITTSRDILEAIAEGNGPPESLIALGYAGWGADQLEAEIAKNSWLQCPVSAEIIFNTQNENKWAAAVALLGININSLSSDIGHA